ncbi:39S ribosomal protein L39, mitochondrial [Trichuris trichiura]|uniref:39S ribosomal protein L39, mitochondrial n=1 Tax=Trichuris trichiura TaxID=36087 RepID=A0A077Z5P0_TRITR|nr:39S ribosomal protein L39, mitochondrial [Trichuris trichiura]
MSQIRERRSGLFEKERIRQQNLIGLLEKIEVRVHPPKAVVNKAEGEEEEKAIILAMNKDVSTPFDCALHLSRLISDRAALAMVNGVAWDMRRPLPSDCDLKFLFYTDEDPSVVNKAYWRTCSLILGYILETSFKEDVLVTLHSWPAVDVRSGSFVYDVDFGKHNGWQPSEKDFRMLSYVPPKELRKKDFPIERLDVDVSVAKEMFQDNRFKSEQVQSIANTMKKGGKKIPLYRVGDHVDISRGPMISSTAQLGFYNVTAFHYYSTDDFGSLCRVQGVSVPFTQRINSWAWEVVCHNSKAMSPLERPSRNRYVLQAAEEQMTPVNNMQTESVQ